MHSLLSFGTPLLFLALLTWFYDANERSSAWKTFFRGALMAFPSILIWKLFAFCYNPAWGSLVLAISFGIKFWLMPYALAIGAWCILYGWSKLDRSCLKPLTSFFAGFMSLFSIAFVVDLWSSSYIAWVLALPLISLAGTFTVPFAIRELGLDYMPSGIRWILAIVGGSLVAGLAIALFFLRLEWLAILLTLAAGAGTSLFVINKYKSGV